MSYITIKLYSYILPISNAVTWAASPLVISRHHKTIVDTVSQMLAKDIPSGLPRSYRALADYCQVLRSTLSSCAWPTLD